MTIRIIEELLENWKLISIKYLVNCLKNEHFIQFFHAVKN